MVAWPFNDIILTFWFLIQLNARYLLNSSMISFFDFCKFKKFKRLGNSLVFGKYRKNLLNFRLI